MNATRIVLVGGGHAHLHVLLHADEFTRRNLELVLLDPGPFRYSGTATGLLGGRYREDEIKVDLQRLANARGARWIGEFARSVNPAMNRLTTASGEDIGFDLLSLNLGSVVGPVPPVRGEPRVWPVKPLARLAGLRGELERDTAHPHRLLVIGGGPTGCEVAANLAALRDSHVANWAITLLTADERLCNRFPEGASRALHRHLVGLGIRVALNCPVRELTDHAAVTAHGRSVPFDHVVTATGLEPRALALEGTQPWPRGSGLPVAATLQWAGASNVFAAGDCADMVGHRLPRIGVYGVRQAPVLLHNLLAAVDGNPMRLYTPQSQYLSILNLGNDTALAVRGRCWWMGKAAMWLKDQLDSRFLAQYREAAISGR